MSKKCPKCGEVRGVGEWYKNKTKRDGLASWCKECCKLYEAKPERKLRHKFHCQLYYWNHSWLCIDRARTYQLNKKFPHMKNMQPEPIKEFNFDQLI